MNEAALRSLVRDVLSDIAPEADLSCLPGSADLRETLDLDSMDFLNFLIALHQRTGIDIPEQDQRRLSTLDDAVAYLSRPAPPA